ncbi:hypothetical protein [Cyclobacterium sp.]|nr:hypothetical protein [Cyclobacterium sp.]
MCCKEAKWRVFMGVLEAHVQVPLGPAGIETHQVMKRVVILWNQ